MNRIVLEKLLLMAWENGYREAIDSNEECFPTIPFDAWLDMSKTKKLIEGLK